MHWQPNISRNKQCLLAVLFTSINYKAMVTDRGNIWMDLNLETGSSGDKVG